MGYDVGFAKKYFPSRANVIDQLAARDENFRDLCVDFETADEHRRKWETASGHQCGTSATRSMWNS